MKKIIFLSLMGFLFSEYSESSNIPNNQPTNNQERRVLLYQLSENPQKSAEATNTDSDNELFKQLKALNANIDNISDPNSILLKAGRSLIERLLTDPQRFSLPSFCSPKMIDNELHHEALDAVIRLDYLYGHYLYAQFLIGQYKEHIKAEAAIEQELDILDFLPTLFPAADKTLTIEQEQTFQAFWKLVTSKFSLIACKNMAHILIENHWLAELTYYGGTPLSHWLALYCEQELNPFAKHCNIDLNAKDRNQNSILRLAHKFNNRFLVNSLLAYPDIFEEDTNGFLLPLIRYYHVYLPENISISAELGLNFYDAIRYGKINTLKRWWSQIKNTVESGEIDYSLGFAVSEALLVDFCKAMIQQSDHNVLWTSLYQAGVNPTFLARLMYLSGMNIVNKSQNSHDYEDENILDTVLIDYFNLISFEISDDNKKQNLLLFIQNLVLNLNYTPSDYSLYYALSFCEEDVFDLLVRNIRHLCFHNIYGRNGGDYNCFNPSQAEINMAKYITLGDALDCLNITKRNPDYAMDKLIFKRLVLRKTAENTAINDNYEEFKSFCDQNFKKLIRDQKRNLSTDILEDLSSTLRYHNKEIEAVPDFQEKLDYLEVLESKVAEEPLEDDFEEEEPAEAYFEEEEEPAAYFQDEAPEADIEEEILEIDPEEEPLENNFEEEESSEPYSEEEEVTLNQNQHQ